MLRPETLRILQAADDPDHLEYPPGFDRARAWANAEALATDVERISGRKLELDKNVQDASFFTDLCTIETVPAGSLGVAHLLTIRLSAFGSLATISMLAEETIAPATVTEVIDAIHRHGYVYVDRDELDGEPYTGLWRGAPISSWWVRFFDYL